MVMSDNAAAISPRHHPCRGRSGYTEANRCDRGKCVDIAIYALKYVNQKVNLGDKQHAERGGPWLGSVGWAIVLSQVAGELTAIETSSATPGSKGPVMVVKRMAKYHDWTAAHTGNVLPLRVGGLIR